MTTKEAEAVWNEFMDGGYIERIKCGENCWHNKMTPKGKELAKANWKHAIDPNKTTLNLKEAAEFIGTTSKELTRMAKGLTITGYKIKGRWAFDRSVLETFNETGRDPSALERLRIYVDNAAVNNPYRINPTDKSESQFKETGTKFRIVKTEN